MFRRHIIAASLFAFGAIACSLFAEVFADAPKADAKTLKQRIVQARKELAKKQDDEASRLAALAEKQEQARKDEAKKKALAAEKAKNTKALATVAAIADGKQNVGELSRRVDSLIDEALAKAGVTPSPRCSDDEYLRRVCLDITGVIPTAEKAKAFLDSTAPDKRARLIDELLADPNYGRKQADIWLAKLFPKDSANRFVQPEPFSDWIRKEFNANTPWDRFVSKIIATDGTVDEHPEVTFYLANRSIDKLTDATTQHFLGVRLGCAQCHDHPFTNTKQTEYWGMAAFFSKVLAEKPKNPLKGGEQTSLGVKEGVGQNRQKDFFPESAKKVSAKFYEGPEPALDPKEPFRPELAKWLTSKTNPYFAKAMVNRTWGQLFGSGIVDPIDDLIVKNKPSHPELLDELARHFAETGFDMKYLIRGLCNSQAYQRSAKPLESNKDDAELFSHLAVKQCSPEQLFDSLSLVLGATKPDLREKAKAAFMKYGPSSERDRFVQFFLAGTEEVSPTDYEAGIPQALRMMNSKNSQILSAAKTLTSGMKPTQALEVLYLTALSRRPTAEEVKRLSQHIGTTNPTEAYSDILWALLNSSEFSMIR